MSPGLSLSRAACVGLGWLGVRGKVTSGGELNPVQAIWPAQVLRVPGTTGNALPKAFPPTCWLASLRPSHSQAAGFPGEKGHRFLLGVSSGVETASR